MITAGGFFAPRHRRGAFTLLECLVVVSIVSLATCLMIPAIRVSQDSFRATLCAARLRDVGVACHGFAALHEGRFPGRAHRFRPYQSSITWQNILNSEYYRNSGPTYPIPEWGSQTEPILRIWIGDQDLLATRIVCPSARVWGDYPNLYARRYVMNRDACGGPNWGSNPPEGPYGKAVTNPQGIDPSYDFYALGAKTMIFPNPSYQFLVVENERAIDETSAMWPYVNPVYLGVDPMYPPWSSEYGVFAFRHMLPSDESQYQDRARANFLHIDGHVSQLGPNDRVNLVERFSPQ